MQVVLAFFSDCFKVFFTYFSTFYTNYHSVTKNHWPFIHPFVLIAFTLMITFRHVRFQCFMIHFIHCSLPFLDVASFLVIHLNTLLQSPLLTDLNLPPHRPLHLNHHQWTHRLKLGLFRYFSSSYPTVFPCLHPCHWLKLGLRGKRESKKWSDSGTRRWRRLMLTFARKVQDVSEKGLSILLVIDKAEKYCW